mmetsp:Transcript_748/g.2251  ORF Transcript_748/g.2251 Transcript_748/m.2251 type:complete len:280 (-) Transcript_748:4-843(-)
MIHVALRHEAASSPVLGKRRDVVREVVFREPAVLRDVRRPPRHVRDVLPESMIGREVQLARHPRHDGRGARLGDAVVQHAARPSRRAFRVPRRHVGRGVRAFQRQSLGSRHGLPRAGRLRRRRRRVPRRLEMLLDAFLIRADVRDPLRRRRRDGAARRARAARRRPAVSDDLDALGRGRRAVELRSVGPALRGGGAALPHEENARQRPTRGARGPRLQEVAQARPRRLRRGVWLVEASEHEEAVALASLFEKRLDGVVPRFVRRHEAPRSRVADPAFLV